MRRHVEPLGPANNASLEVTQELAALLYVEEPGSIDPVLPAFHDGLFNNPPPDDPDLLAVWESGAFASELFQIRGQR
jgi:hypothetical protein